MEFNRPTGIAALLAGTASVLATLTNGLRGQEFSMLSYSVLAGLALAAATRAFTPPGRRQPHPLPEPLRRWVASAYGPGSGTTARPEDAVFATYLMTTVVMAAGLYGLTWIMLLASDVLWGPLVWPFALLLGSVTAALVALAMSWEPREACSAGTWQSGTCTQAEREQETGTR